MKKHTALRKKVQTASVLKQLELNNKKVLKLDKEKKRK